MKGPCASLSTTALFVAALCVAVVPASAAWPAAVQPTVRAPTCPSISRGGNNPSFSNVITFNGVVTTAGLVAPSAVADAAAGGLPNVTAQAEEIFARADALLDGAGTSKGRLLTATVWLADIRDFGAMNAAWRAWVDPRARPVRATVEGKLALPAFVVEMQFSAAAGCAQRG